ncbi:MAG: hypothetical protein M3R41_02655 [Pseudomonadota bacterium]|nr:hypothetical protein [Pseudomonadota bacterium]
MAALLAIVIGAVVLIVCLVLALKLIALVIGVAAAVLVYFVAEKLVGKGN